MNRRRLEVAGLGAVAVLLLVGPIAAAGAIGPPAVPASHALARATLTADETANLSNELNGISCAGPSRCVAVGDTVDPSSRTYSALVESWDGGSWSVTPSPGPAGFLLGVSCASSSACMAVGYALGQPTGPALAESWNGTSWTAVPVPSRSGMYNVLYGVSCTSPTQCMAVGTSSVPAGLPGQGTR